MKKLFLGILLFFSFHCFSQNEQLAAYYFEKGDFEKAKINYQELLDKVPQNRAYFLRIVECYQQLQQYDLAEKILETHWNKYHQAPILVALGYTFQLQKKENKAKAAYNQALEQIQKKPQEVYGVASAFESKVLLNYALKAYETATALQPNYNFNYQKALLYGQLGNTQMMVTTLLDEAYATPENADLIKSQLARFMADATESSFSDSVKKELILRVQKSQEVFWNRYLSWFYVQQKEFGKAFIQEKAIYKRLSGSLSAIVSLAQQAIEEQEEQTATEILEFVIQNTTDADVVLQADTYLIKIQIEKAQPQDLVAIGTALEALLVQHKVSPYSLPLQLIRAHFVTFNLKNPDLGKAILQQALALPLTEYEVAQVKMELADILLFEQKFNQALLYYSQIQLDLKNDAVAHEASLKAAKTSYFKTDFTWALKQFKELKAANTQLIANDALAYFLLLNDNLVADSTQTALKDFALGDYLVYQNRNDEAIVQFQSILQKYKGQEIEAITLLRLGTMYDKKASYDLALNQYQQILTQHSQGIYVDEALYFSAEIYAKKLTLPEKAKPLYEKIIFEHQDSIYFVEARKSFRQLRGDPNL
ncbi:tetratricopeptide repeat protein [Flavobacterium crassostreae]|uniref:Tetratricopeptide repeat protein n=1 Tax=Flavobacterium crassostreae TaxID=1763534 RepID=A0A1B9E0B7_9FLAO|nr:tetratricopeptide repeat protein [Flavobacterium crassostreae]OCB75380.1 hypothetical protein LPBF_08270 [Flavobacterium crassostreae]